VPQTPYSLDALDRRIVHALQGDLPLEPRPYDALAKGLGISEPQLLDRIAALRAAGVIRRLGAILRHRRAGLEGNVMVAWCVPPERVTATGTLFAGFREVSHCYTRRPAADWPYNLYTMVHGRARADCLHTVEAMATAAGVARYVTLFSRREFKKTSMEYF